MGVTYQGVGFHDATWRNRFGGTIYKTNGSHGCINTPFDNMKTCIEILAMFEIDNGKRTNFVRSLLAKDEDWGV